MRVPVQLAGVGTAAAIALSLFAAAPVAASTAHSGITCSGTFASPGFIAPGTYSSVKVTGVCLGPAGGTVIVKDDVTVAKGGALYANYPSFGPGAPEGDATFLVKGDVAVGKGATLLLGCEPAVGCVNTTFDTVRGNVDADGALGVILHSDIIGGNVTYQGGGGGVNCNPGQGAFGFGVYSDLEDDVVGGNVRVSHLQSCWFGEFRNIVLGNDTVEHNTFADPDATEVQTNTVFGKLACSGNAPAAQIGDSGGSPNIVLGKATGECAAISVH